MIRADQEGFNRLEFLAWVAMSLNRIEAGAAARGEHYSANAIKRVLSTVGSHIRLGADLAITDAATIRAMFERDAAAEAMTPEQLVEHERQWADAAAEHAAAEARSDEA